MDTVSVVSCCRNEILYIEGFLDSLESQQLENFELEAIIADGESSDGTRAVLDGFSAQHPWVRGINNPGKIASTGLNAAIRLSRGSVLVRMDAHTEYAPDYVAQCLRVLHEKQAAMVGGPMRLAAGSYWQNTIALAYPSEFFSGGSLVYDIHYNGPVDSVLYGCWPRTVIEKMGGFDEDMIRNQDDELSFRIVQAGGLIWQSSAIRCWYHPRKSPLALASQFFGYGLWKVYSMRKHRTVVSLRHVLPAACLTFFFAILTGAAVNRTSRQLFFWFSVAYGTVVAAAAAVRVRTWRDWPLYFGLLVVFPVAHVAYGLGTLCGLLRARNKHVSYSPVHLEGSAA